MSNYKDNVLGKVKYEVLEELFKMGDLAHPDTVLKEITDAMEKYNASEKDKFDKSVSLKGFLGFGKKQVLYYNKFKRPAEFIRAIREGEINDVSEIVSDAYFVDLWYKIQDIRVVLNLKCVAKHSQSNNLMANSTTLLTIDRVLSNKKEYLEL